MTTSSTSASTTITITTMKTEKRKKQNFQIFQKQTSTTNLIYHTNTKNETKKNNSTGENIGKTTVYRAAAVPLPEVDADEANEVQEVKAVRNFAAAQSYQRLLSAATSRRTPSASDTTASGS